MDQNRLEYLYFLYIQGLCKEEELQELISLAKNPVYDVQLKKLMDGTWNELNEADLKDITDVRADEIYNDIVLTTPHKKVIRKLWPRIAAAAMILVSLSAIFYFHNQPKKQTAAKIGPVHFNKIQPGSNKAILTLSDGKEIELNDAGKGQLAIQSNVVISKLKDGQIVYDSGSQEYERGKIQMNTITIPKGGQYHIILPDGSRVYLNSESTLTYPVNFSGNERIVRLTGEAYFEIARNAAMPFKVEVNDKQTVEVLGTHFNVMAYDGDRQIITTLIEGSVKVSNKKSRILLKPGFSAINYLSNSSFKAIPADIDEVTAWKNGYFIFNNENIRSIMKKISRWYDIEVEFQGNMENKDFLGIYKRSAQLKDLLKDIESTDKVHFKTDGRRITIISKQ